MVLSAAAQVDGCPFEIVNETRRFIVEGNVLFGKRGELKPSRLFLFNDTLIWAATNRVVDGEKQPDTTLRIVRQAPEPAAE